MAIHGGDIYKNKIEYDFSVNLNPNRIPESLIEAVKSSVNKISLYPDIDQDKVRTQLAKIDNITKDMVVAGNGASELIMAVTKAVNPKKVLIAEPSFYGYRHAVNSLENCEIVIFDTAKYYDEQNITGDDFGFALVNSKVGDLGATQLAHEGNSWELFLDYIDESLDLIYLANPANPSGKLIDENSLERIINKAYEAGVYVLLDESFIYMSDAMLYDNFSNRTDEWAKKNVFIIRSFTKLFSVPGVRAGFVIASEKNIDKVRKHLPEWNLSVMAESVLIEGAGIIKDTDFVKESCKIIKSEREYLVSQIKALDYKVYESDTAYILFKSELDLYKRLLSKGILIRDCSNYEGLNKGYYRIAVRSREYNDILITALRCENG